MKAMKVFFAVVVLLLLTGWSDLERAMIARADEAMEHTVRLTGREAVTPPDFFFVDKASLCMAYREKEECSIMAVYEPWLVIINKDEVDVFTDFGMSVLIHEFVHHLDFHDRADNPPDCHEAVESEHRAYAAQIKYLEEIGEQKMAKETRNSWIFATLGRCYE